MKSVLILGRLHMLSLSMALSIGLLPWSEKLNTISIIILLAGVLLDLAFSKQKYRLDIRQFLIGAGVFFVALAWLPFSEDLSTGWSYLERILTAFLFPLLFSSVVKRYELKVQLIFFVFLASCATRYIFFLVGLLELELIFILDYWKEILIQYNQFFKQGALHPTYFSMYLGFCSIICFYFFSKAMSLGKRFFWILSMFVFLLLNLSLASKMPFIATFVALAFGVFFHVYRIRSGSGKKRYLGVLTLGILVFGIYLYKVPNAIKQDIGNYYDYFTERNLENAFDYNQYGINYSMETWNKTNRIHIWNSSISLFKTNFLLGVGTGDMRNELNKQYVFDNQPYLSNENANTHNQYLDYLIKFGVIGFGVLVFCFYTYFKKALGTSNYTYLMFLILVSICMSTENILNRQLGIVFFFFFQNLFFYLTSKDFQTFSGEN